MSKFQNKYRIESARWQNWDYGANAAYFVTLCTQNRQCYFGEIVESIMHRSAIGQLVHDEWLKTADLRADMNLQLGEFVVMPNHFHAIVVIGVNQFNEPKKYNDRNVPCRDAMHCVFTTQPIANSVQNMVGGFGNRMANGQNRFGPQSKNLASIIRGFKSSVTVCARKIDPGFAWQTRFHDHVIRDNESHGRIAQYIINNPARWQEDKLFK